MKRFVSLLLILIMLATACSPATLLESEAETSVEEIASEDQQVEDNASQSSAVEAPADDASTDDASTDVSTIEEAPDTPTDQQTAETASETDQASAQAGTAKCNIDPLRLAKNPALAEITSRDWQHGNSADARITIVEYGDFQ